MSSIPTNNTAVSESEPPPLKRDARGQIETSALADVIQWFLDHDRRVNALRHPKVEEIFQWKQAQDREADEGVYQFDNAESRLAIGIMQALVEYDEERALHEWISQLLNALDESSKTNEEMSQAYHLETASEASVLSEASKIPAERMRSVFLTCCWLEALCTAEIRVLGWIYQELYGRAFHPQNY